MHPIVFLVCCFAATFGAGWYVSKMSYLRGYRDGALDARRRQYSKSESWPKPANDVRAN